MAAIALVAAASYAAESMAAGAVLTAIMTSTAALVGGMLDQYAMAAMAGTKAVQPDHRLRASWATRPACRPPTAAAFPWRAAWRASAASSSGPPTSGRWSRRPPRRTPPAAARPASEIHHHHEAVRLLRRFRDPPLQGADRRGQARLVQRQPGLRLRSLDERPDRPG